MYICFRFMFLTTVILISVFIIFVLFTDIGRSSRQQSFDRDKPVHEQKQKVTFDQIISEKKRFNFSGQDLMILLHIQKTSGTTFEKHLVQDLNIGKQCSCSDEKRRCWCPRFDEKPQSISAYQLASFVKPAIANATWLISRFSTGWICGLHADWTQLTNCLSEFKQLYFMTFIRNPLHRFISEFRHVQRGATWKNSMKHCKYHDTQLCYSQASWSNVTLEQFLNCPNNMALNRQTRMLANHNLIKCSNDNNVDQEMLSSAKKNLKDMAFFGLCDEQLQSQVIFENTFGLKFKRNFMQSNESKAAFIADKLSAEIKAKILQLNSLDVQLYEYASNLFQDRYRRFLNN